MFRLGTDGKSLSVETKLVIEMKSNNAIAPYEFKRVNYCYCLLYTVYNYNISGSTVKEADMRITSCVCYLCWLCSVIAEAFVVTDRFIKELVDCRFVYYRSDDVFCSVFHTVVLTIACHT